jgi:hypothetical protein
VISKSSNFGMKSLILFQRQTWNVTGSDEKANEHWHRGLSFHVTDQTAMKEILPACLNTKSNTSDVLAKFLPHGKL